MGGGGQSTDEKQRMQWEIDHYGRPVQRPVMQDVQDLLFKPQVIVERTMGLLQGSGNKYETKLTPDEEKGFRKWKEYFAPKDSGQDYDLRGAFKSGLMPDPRTGHWPDTFKKPNHPTFSDQSIYASAAPEKAGHWEGDTFIPPEAYMKGSPYGGAAMSPRVQPSISMQMPMSEEARSHMEQQQDLEMRMKVRVINDLLKGKIKEGDKGPDYRGENAFPSMQEFNPMAEVLQRLLGGA